MRYAGRSTSVALELHERRLQERLQVAHVPAEPEEVDELGLGRHPGDDRKRLPESAHEPSLDLVRSRDELRHIRWGGAPSVDQRRVAEEIEMACIVDAPAVLKVQELRHGDGLAEEDAVLGEHGPVDALGQRSEHATIAGAR